MLNSILFADDTVLIAESESDLQKLVSVFDSVCKRRKLTVNVNKSKVMVCERVEVRLWVLYAHIEWVLNVKKNVPSAPVTLVRDGYVRAGVLPFSPRRHMFKCKG